MTPIPDPQDYAAQNYSWPQYRLFVMHEMRRMADALLIIDDRIRKLEIKAAKYGAIAGVVGTLGFEVAKAIVLAVFKK